MSARPSPLPVLGARQRELELCVFCPKLCRAACPVSEAESSETLTPWGKMTTAYLLARGDAPGDASHAATAWACTACHACRERCDHENLVAPTLLDVRAEMFRRGLAPHAASAVAARFAAHESKSREALRAAAREAPVDPRSPVKVAVGCGYVGHEGNARETVDAVRAVAGLVGQKVALVEACSGLPLAEAGDAVGFATAATRFAAEVRGADALVVVDPGCAALVRNVYPALGVELDVRPDTLVELAARSLATLCPIDASPAHPVRWHDPCQLGRGLGLYEQPRQILTRILGRAPDEFSRVREAARCSGGGGLVPVTMPETSREIARARLDDHEALGGGEIVTACGSSLRRFRGSGARASDLATFVSRAVAHVALSP